MGGAGKPMTGSIKDKGRELRAVGVEVEETTMPCDVVKEMAETGGDWRQLGLLGRWWWVGRRRAECVVR